MDKYMGPVMLTCFISFHIQAYLHTETRFICCNTPIGDVLYFDLHVYMYIDLN